MTTQKKILVVGAGIAGLSCAKRLIDDGRDVTVVEKEGIVGGRMSTTLKDGLAFDRGATFLVDSYDTLRQTAQELGVRWKVMKKSRDGFFFLKNKELMPLSFNKLADAVGFSNLSFVEKAMLLAKFLPKLYLLRRKFAGVNFFDFQTLPDEYDDMSAYDFALKEFGQEIADYLVDGFTSTYQFHSAKEISLCTALALGILMDNRRDGFERYHTMPGQMSEIPNAIASCLGDKLFLNKNGTVTPLVGGNGFLLKPYNPTGTTQWWRFKKPFGEYDCIVFAVPSPIVKEIIPWGLSEGQKKFLSSVSFATTINLSFRIRIGLLKGVYCVTVPLRESEMISEFTNEDAKGVVDDNMKTTLVNIGLHEKFAKEIASASDKEIFEAVRDELRRVCPLLKDIPKETLLPHDLVRWQNAMPKFEPGSVKRVKEFWRNGQGENGIYLCGDYVGAPWTEGATLCGQKVAKLIINSSF